MKVLQINSSIRGADAVSSAYAHKIAQKFVAQGAQLTVRDLGTQPVAVLDSELLGPFFSNDLTHPKVAAADALAQELLAQDILIIAAPMYNFSISAQLKNYFDAVAQRGKTFTYTDKGPQGLTHIQKAYVVVTRGGFYSENDFQAQFLEQILKFLGVKEVEFVKLEGLNMGPDFVGKAQDGAEKTIGAIQALAA